MRNCLALCSQVYQVLQLIEVDPFDDDMGLVSLLNYFLSERHSYYVDIHWRACELSHMQIFLSALLRFISFRVSDDCPSLLSHSTASDISQEVRKVPHNADTWTPLQLIALRLLHATLWTFPPHRVVCSKTVRAAPVNKVSWALATSL